MFDAKLRPLIDPPLNRLGSALARRGVTANAITFLGLALGLAGAAAISGGYFGAGAGVIFLALALICTSDSIWRASILKSFLLGIANLVAAIFFAFSGDVNWLAALALAIGAFVGGYSGPPVVKVIPPNFLRLAVVFLGLGLAAWLQFA